MSGLGARLESLAVCVAQTKSFHQLPNLDSKTARQDLTVIKPAMS